MSLFISSSDLISLYLLEKGGRTDQDNKKTFISWEKWLPFIYFKKLPLFKLCVNASDLDTQK